MREQPNFLKFLVGISFYEICAVRVGQLLEKSNGSLSAKQKKRSDNKEAEMQMEREIGLDEERE